MKQILNSSFRDPAGFLFKSDGKLYRQINFAYQKDYDMLVSSGLLNELTQSGLLVNHREVKIEGYKNNAYKIIEPDLIPFISYPYEWCFSQLKSAALLTLDVQIKALEHDMSLKDASAYNVQFIGGKPVFIDTLSFEEYIEGRPWNAYRQFCQHFLAPLVLMAKVNVQMSQLLRVFIDGIPLDLTSQILPWHTKLSPLLYMHIHLHAKAQKTHSNDAQSEKLTADKSSKQSSLSRHRFMGLLDSFRSTISKLQWLPENTEWGDYYEDTNYSEGAHEHKKKIVRSMAKDIFPSMTWDLGANNGEFSRQALEFSDTVVSWDIDDAAIEKHYLSLQQSESEQAILPLRLDLTNPSNGIGWAGAERDSLEKRGKADLVMALALIHHLAISNNVPLDKIAYYFSKLGHNLILEFVPKSDSQVKRLLTSREDVFPDYTQEKMLMAFSPYFDLVKSTPVDESDRTIFLFSTKKQ